MIHDDGMLIWPRDLESREREVSGDDVPDAPVETVPVALLGWLCVILAGIGGVLLALVAAS